MKGNCVETTPLESETERKEAKGRILRGTSKTKVYLRGCMDT